jgi:uncharacterized protein
MRHNPLFTFLVLVSILSALSYIYTFNGGEENISIGFLLLQFSPAVAAILTKLMYNKNIRGLGWGWDKTRYQLISFVLPFLLSFIAFGLVWTLGFGGFYNEVFILEAQNGLAETFGLHVASPYILMLILILINTTIGLFVGFGAIGEEIGWRGFLVPELFKYFNFTKTSIISGLIWGLYHFPLIIILIAPKLNVSVWPLLAFTTVSAIGLSFIMAWLRLKSGSVWTAIIFHSALNIHIQGFFQPLTTEISYLTNYVSGEQGLMIALVTAVVAYGFWKKQNQL